MSTLQKRVLLAALECGARSVQSATRTIKQ